MTIPGRVAFAQPGRVVNVRLEGDAATGRDA